MWNLNEFLMLLFSLSGILCGLILSYIASEELAVGKKYFLWFKKIILTLMLSLCLYVLAVTNLIFFLVFLLLGAVILVGQWKKPSLWWEIGVYLLFVITYFFLPELILREVLVVLLFLYGFPLGSLLRQKV